MCTQWAFPWQVFLKVSITRFVARHCKVSHCNGLIEVFRLRNFRPKINSFQVGKCWNDNGGWCMSGFSIIEDTLYPHLLFLFKVLFLVLSSWMLLWNSQKCYWRFWFTLYNMTKLSFYYHYYTVQGVHWASEIGEFSVYLAEFSG